MYVRKQKSSEPELGGQDSFLDLVSNIVGILIILVMVAGIRAQYSSATPAAPPQEFATPQMVAELEEKQLELQTKRETVLQKRQHIDELHHQSSQVAEQLFLQGKEHAALFDLMTTVRAAIEITAEEKSQTFKEKIEYHRQLLESQAQLEQVEQKKAYFSQIRPQATVMENVPTPLAKLVDGDKEIHFRLLGGKIAYVPFSEIQLLLRRNVSEEQNRYVKQSEIKGKVGPVDNFELHFLLASFDVPMNGGLGRRIELQYGEMIPTYEPMGQTLPAALDSPDSEFRRKLALFRKDIYSVTVWVYPDSFEEYQELKKFLYEQGYSVAARPLAMEQNIGISPFGTKSAAQ